MKIRTRLTVQFIAISVVIFAVALLFIFQQFRRYVENEFYDHLENKGRMTASMILQEEGNLKVIQQPLPGKAGVLPPLGNISIFDEHLDCVFTVNRDAPLVRKSDLLKVRESSPFRFENGPFRAIGLYAFSPSGRRYLVIVEEEPDFSKLDKLRNILVLAFFLVIAFVAAGGWFYAGQALLPVSFIVNEVDRILPADLSRRLKENNNRDELSHLTNTFNQLLDRIEQAFHLQRGFISNVSHELRNPIAMIDAQLQLALNKPRTQEEYDRVLVSVMEDIQELSDTVDKLLQLASIYSGGSPAIFSIIRLDELIYQARANLLKSHPGYAVNIEIRKLPEEERELCVRGNEFLLRTAILNLLDNCCKFSGDRKACVVIDYDTKYQLCFEDNGPGIPSQDLPFIFEPFYRGRQSNRQKGSGIGLSLVRSILQLHQVEWKVESLEGSGTRFFLAFPKAGTYDMSMNNRGAQIADPLPNHPGSKGNRLVKFFLIGMMAFSLMSCSGKRSLPVKEEQLGFKVVQEWNALLLKMVRHASGYKAPVSARMFGYVGMASWEAGNPAFMSNFSAAELCPGLDLPDWKGEEEFCAAASLNASFDALAQGFFPNLPLEVHRERVELTSKWEELLSTRKWDKGAITASAAFGRSVADVIFRWSVEDSIGNQAFLSNFRAVGWSEKRPGAWQPNFGKGFGLLPDWGNAHTFVVATEDVAVKPPVQFSEKPQTPFFRQAMEIYTISRPVSTDRKTIAHYWSNDYPRLSVCPASRWIAIAHQIMETEQPELPLALETYMKLGFALNDAAVKVWKEKYRYNLERPDVYIARNIDPHWRPLEESPPFPTYPSGHSTFGAAAAAILEAAFGHAYSFTDYSNEEVGPYAMEPRKFSSFESMALENALSRVYMGVHYRMDCEEGLRLGRVIGKKIADMEMHPAEKLAASPHSEN